MSQRAKVDFHNKKVTQRREEGGKDKRYVRPRCST